jgi:organic hydroperoxide reductase OsmC/OhrA
MSATRPVVREFDVSVDSARTARSSRGGAAFEADAAWTAEHVLLAALVRCTLTSLDHHLHRGGLTGTASGSAHGKVTKRESDGLYAFVEIEARYEVELTEPPDPESVLSLVERAERGCFVGNSLAVRPRYRWTVNGKEVR